jgi:hypothetical protein
VVECNLAKVEVAGSNPVSRSAKAIFRQVAFLLNDKQYGRNLKKCLTQKLQVKYLIWYGHSAEPSAPNTVKKT